MTERPRRVVVVDDTPDFLEFMQLLLSSEGFDVRVARSIADAEREIASEPPDLVICDVRMPEAPPFAFLDRLLADAATRDLPVVLCTGAVQEVRDAEERLARAHVEVLFKPFEIDTLLACIARALQAAPLSTSPPGPAHRGPC